MFWRKSQGDTKTTVTVNQSGAKIGIAHVDNLQCTQIAASIHYNVKPQPTEQNQASEGSGQSIAIGMTREDLDKL